MDRNVDPDADTLTDDVSLSARRAWIEIARQVCLTCRVESLSARRAWIEIPAGCWRDSRRAVALRKESVDRNMRFLPILRGFIGRSPQGERG